MYYRLKCIVVSVPYPIKVFFSDVCFILFTIPQRHQFETIQHNWPSSNGLVDFDQVVNTDGVVIQAFSLSSVNHVIPG